MANGIALRQRLHQRLAGGALIFSAYLGGAATKWTVDRGLDADEIAHVTGSTNSAASPTAAPIQSLAALLDAS